MKYYDHGGGWTAREMGVTVGLPHAGMGVWHVLDTSWLWYVSARPSHTASLSCGIWSSSFVSTTVTRSFMPLIRACTLSVVIQE